MSLEYGDHVLATREVRENISGLLRQFRSQGSAAPAVLIGAHRKPEGVILSYDRYQELMEMLDDRMIAIEVTKRLTETSGEMLSFDELANAVGIDPADIT